MEETSFYTVTELAALAGCRPQMIYNYLHSRRIPYRYENRTYLIPKEDADLWVKAYKERKEATNG